MDDPMDMDGSTGVDEVHPPRPHACGVSLSVSPFTCHSFFFNATTGLRAFEDEVSAGQETTCKEGATRGVVESQQFKKTTPGAAGPERRGICPARHRAAAGNGFSFGAFLSSNFPEAGLVVPSDEELGQRFDRCFGGQRDGPFLLRATSPRLDGAVL